MTMPHPNSIHRHEVYHKTLSNSSWKKKKKKKNAQCLEIATYNGAKQMPALYFLWTFSGFMEIWFVIPSTDESWKIAVERESRGSRSHEDLTHHLLNYLRSNYPGIQWVVNVYDDVYGFKNHAVRGNFYSLFRHYGHNIVVGKLNIGQSTPLQNLDSTFREAFTIKCNWYGIDGLLCDVDPGRTVIATWNELRRRGITPVMLHIVRYSIDIESANNFDARYLSSQEMPGTALATLIATN